MSGGRRTRRRTAGPRHSRVKPDFTPFVVALLSWLAAAALLYMVVPEAAPFVTTALAAGFFGYTTYTLYLLRHGRTLAKWKRGLIGPPLRLASGPRMTWPPEAARDQPALKQALICCLALTAILAGLALAILFRALA